MIPPIQSSLFYEVEHSRKTRRVVSDNGQNTKEITEKDDAHTHFKETLPLRIQHLLSLPFDEALDKMNKMSDSEFMRMEMSRAYLAAGRLIDGSHLITLLENERLKSELIHQTLPFLCPIDAFGMINQLIAHLPLSEQSIAFHNTALKYLLMGRKDRALELLNEMPEGPFKAMLSPFLN